MPQAVKVGIFVSLCLVVLGYLVFRIEDWSFFGPQGQRVEAVFDSVAGLDERAPVRVAGVRVGTVEALGLDGSRARVTLLLERPVPLTDGSYARIANAGILGDKYVELVLGPSSAAPLAAGTVLPGETPVSFDEALARFDKLGESLQEVTGDLTSSGDMGATLRRLLDNLEATSADIRQLVASNRDQVNATLGNFERFSSTLAQELPALTEKVSRLLEQVDGVVAENRGELRGSLENIRDVTGRIQTSVDNLNDISSQIRSGEGTLGKLVYDDAAHDSLVSTLGAVEEGVGTLNETLGRAQRLELLLGLEGAVYPDVDNGAAEVSIRLSTHPRRFYRIGLGDTPQGRVRTETRVVTTTLPDGTVETTTIEERKIEDKFTFDAQLGYRLGDFTVRAGLIDSAAGGALDYHVLDRRLSFSLEAFDFSRPEDLDPHLRFTTRYQLNPNIYLLGGYDDFLTDETESVFFGAGIRWKDDDLKYLLGSVPISF
ncbi:MAG: MCE family protein [Holophagales bacterium]|nr:MCE family protein [Holophagales bacterium]